ncbi:MAG: EamA family transporter [Bryobacterales bacterium]|nr:EamA family transporter [Bryobacteraceae bacterium]MDW8129638.1 EamA family transporter [Bryobacterales bacterium]
MSWVLVIIVAVTASLGDALQTLGMKLHGEIHDFRLGALAAAFRRLLRSWHLGLSLLLLAISFGAFLGLLAIADLSFAVPATAVEYVLTTLLARYLLGEKVNWRRWAGAGLVACGVVLLAL